MRVNFNRNMWKLVRTGGGTGPGAIFGTQFFLIKVPVLRIRDVLPRIRIRRPFSHPGSGSKHFFIPDSGGNNTTFNLLCLGQWALPVPVANNEFYVFVFVMLFLDWAAGLRGVLPQVPVCRVQIGQQGQGWGSPRQRGLPSGLSFSAGAVPVPVWVKPVFLVTIYQCCGSETILFSSGSGSYLNCKKFRIPVPDPTLNILYFTMLAIFKFFLIAI
jgi:hypothetical protein